MQSEKSGEFGSVEATHNLWLFYKKNTELLKQAHQIIMAEHHEEYPKGAVLTSLLYATIDTSESVLHLAHLGKIRDCFVLARTIFETIVNICFIRAKGDEAAQRASRHADQKAYRDLNRVLHVGKSKITVKLEQIETFDLEDHQDLKKAVEEFTSRKGREITSWTPETVQEEIEVIESVYGTNVSVNLMFALISIYRHASEISHGTYFGALFALGLVSPSGIPTSKEEMAKQHRRNLSMILMMLGLSISSLLVILFKDMQSASLKELAIQSKKAVEELKKEPWAKEKMPS